MARLFVLWTRPQHLSDEDAEAWACGELSRIVDAPCVRGARLTRLRSAASHHCPPWDWMLEVDVAHPRDLRAYIESPTWREWLADLRLLGMQPAAMVADGGRPLGENER